MTKARRGPPGAPKKKGDKMQTGTGSDPSESTGPHMDSKIQNEIGKHLRAHYDDLVKEPIPDKFMELLQKLEQSRNQKS